MSESLLNLVKRLWQDDAGAVITAEYLALGSIVALGGVSGLVAMRDASVAEMEEYGRSIRSVSQEYRIPAQASGSAYRGGTSVSDTYSPGAAGQQVVRTQPELYMLAP